MRRMLRSMLAASLLMGTALPTAAATLASGFIFSTGAILMECQISNAGKKPVTVGSTEVIGLSGDEDLVTTTGCFGAIAPRQTCSFAARVGSDGGRGQAEIGGSAAGVRGVCQLTDENNVILAATEMR